MTNEEIEFFIKQDADLMGKIAQAIEIQLKQQEQITQLFESLTKAYEYIDSINQVLEKNNLF